MARPQDVENQCHRVGTHHFGAIRARIDMAMQAGLVAFVAEVYLQYIDLAAPQSRKIRFCEQGQCGSHCVFLEVNKNPATVYTLDEPLWLQHEKPPRLVA